jgi:F0F1-type ATP synthase membrane subunit b/b'
VFQTASFGVFAAFVCFFGLFGRMMWRALNGALRAYQERVQDQRDEAESLLREAQDLLKRAQEEANDLSQQLAAIRKNTADQIAHMDKQEAQLMIALKAQADETVAADIRRVQNALAKKLLSRTLEATISHVQDTLAGRPKGAAVSEGKVLNAFFEANSRS